VAVGYEVHAEVIDISTAKFIQLFGSLGPKRLLEGGKEAAFRKEGER
jgi:hypothetical protein